MSKDKENLEVSTLLEDVEELLSDYEDVVDGDGEGPGPNRAMALNSRVREFLEGMKNSSSLSHTVKTQPSGALKPVETAMDVAKRWPWAIDAADDAGGGPEPFWLVRFYRALGLPTVKP